MDIVELKEWMKRNEDDHHDFKQNWHKEKHELIRDILSFANTTHHDDCFIIFGVSDKHKIIGIESDKNRLRQDNLLDMINKLPISGDHYPKIRIETIEYGTHEIDVLKILNTNDVPIYLNQRWPTRDPKKCLTPGQIFMREGDRNVAKDKTAEYPEVEKLWQKHFRFDVPIIERYKYVLRDLKNWSYYETSQENGFFYNLNPDFNMILIDDSQKRSDILPYSLNYIDSTIYWDILKLNYRQITIKEIMVVWLDGGRYISVAPKVGEIPSLNEKEFYYYINSESTEGLIQQFFDFFNKYQKNEIDPLLPFYESVVIFESEKEKNKIENIISKNWNTISKDLDPTEEELEMIPIDIINFCKRDGLKAPNEVFAILLQQQKLAKKIKCTVQKYRQPNNINDK